MNIISLTQEFAVLALCFAFACFFVWVGGKWATWRLTGNCLDCGDTRENDGLCHDCRQKLWGELEERKP